MTHADILYVGPFDFPDRNAAAQLVEATAQAITRGGRRVAIVGRASDGDIVDTRLALGDGLEVAFASRRNQHALVALGCVLRYVERATRSPGVSVIIVYNAPAPLLFALIALGRLRNIAIIPHCTEWYAVTVRRSRLLRLLVKWVDTSVRMRVAHRCTRAILVSSRYLANFYKRQKVLTLPTLSPEPDEPQRAALPSAVPKVVYAGVPFELGVPDLSTRELKDRLDTIIKLLAKVAERRVAFEFHIYGLTAAEYLYAFPADRRLLESSRNWLYFHGRVSHVEVAASVQDADFTILIRDSSTVTRAGFPTKVTESIVAGTPVIVSDIGDTALYITPGETGYVLPAAEPAAVTLLQQILALSAEERLRLKSNCRDDDRLRLKSWVEPLARFLEANTVSNGASR